MILQEKNKLKLLKTRIDKYHDLTKSMTKILTTFEHRLGTLEQTILPVYNETETLQNRQHSKHAHTQNSIGSCHLFTDNDSQTSTCQIWT